ncbi:MAG: radical SAM protein [Elusimicrobia bacterium]|nr:radical SAM protein [Elusimicrobiota bacterium]
MRSKAKKGYDPREDIPYELVRLGYACNENCVFCNVDRRPEERRRDDRALRNAMRSALLAGVRPGARISISGGEPGLYKGLPALIKLYRAKKAAKVDVQTNAVCFADRALAAAAARAGATSAFVSLHSHSARVHDGITGVPGSHALCLKGIDNLLACGLEVILNPVLCSRNYRGAARYIDFVSRRFPAVRTVSLSVVQPRGRAKADPRLVPDYAALSPYVEAALSLAEKKGLVVNNPVCGLPLCVGGWHERTERCVEAALGRTSRRSDAGKVFPPLCSGCRVRDYCGGVWPEYLEIHGVSGLGTL